MPIQNQFDREKLKAVVLYTCAKCPPGQLGAVKLHKVLYFADMLRYVQTRHAMTGARYRKRPYGPTCVQLLPILSEMERSGQIEINEVNHFGFRKIEYVALAAPLAGVLQDSEMELLDEVIDFVCAHNTARTISDYSHQAPWERAEFGAEIPYTTAYMLLPNIVSEEAFKVTAAGLKDVEEARQGNDAVVFTDFEAFRRRIRAKVGTLSS